MREVQLTQGKIALIDDEDYELISKYKWHYSKSSINYGRAMAQPTKHGKAIRMHRLIMQALDHLEVDHINNNPLDNRRSNLRLVTHAQNQKNMQKSIRNKSGYKGVSWHKKAKKWQAFVGKYYLGLFEDAKEAAEAYNREALSRFGTYAQLNEIVK